MRPRNPIPAHHACMDWLLNTALVEMPLEQPTQQLAPFGLQHGLQRNVAEPLTLFAGEPAQQRFKLRKRIRVVLDGIGRVRINRPGRKRQFKKLLPKVNNVSTAKRVITYIDQNNPLSIFGRWDLGYGETDYPKQIPDGAVDAKAACSAMVRSLMDLDRVVDIRSRTTGFWMLYATPKIKGKPFVWSDSA